MLRAFQAPNRRWSQMTSPEIVPRIPILPIAHFVYWPLVLLCMPGTSEHAAVYLGHGRVMNVNPNRKPSIHEQSLQEFIQGFDEQNLRFLRFTDEEAANRKVIDWIRCHQQL